MLTPMSPIRSDTKSSSRLVGPGRMATMSSMMVRLLAIGRRAATQAARCMECYAKLPVVKPLTCEDACEKRGFRISLMEHTYRGSSIDWG